MVPVNSVSMMEKRLRIMMGTIFVLLDGVFLLLLFAWLVRETEAGKGFWSKAYHMLLLSLMKVDIAMAQGMEYFLSLIHIYYRFIFIASIIVFIIASYYDSSKLTFSPFTRNLSSNSSAGMGL